jgi:hypothetical protein
MYSLSFLLLFINFTFPFEYISSYVFYNHSFNLANSYAAYTNKKADNPMELSDFCFIMRIIDILRYLLRQIN